MLYHVQIIRIIHTYFYSFNLCQSPFLKDTCRAPFRPLIFGRTFNEFYNETSLHVKRNMFCCMQYTGNITLFTSVLCCFRFSIHIEECTKNYEKNSYRCLFQIFHLTRLPNSQRMKNYLQTFQ